MLTEFVYYRVISVRLSGKARKRLAGAAVRAGSMWRTVVEIFSRIRYFAGGFIFFFFYYSVIAADLILHTTDRICVGWMEFCIVRQQCC